jgi:hypothetical protein
LVTDGWVGAAKESAVVQGSEPRPSSLALPATPPLAEKLGQYFELAPAEREFLLASDESADGER